MEIKIGEGTSGVPRSGSHFRGRRLRGIESEFVCFIYFFLIKF